jgi:hypothetical protein
LPRADVRQMVADLTPRIAHRNDGVACFPLSPHLNIATY